MKFALPSYFTREEFWLGAGALVVGLVVAWILRGAPPGQAAMAEDDSDAPRSGYRDRMVTAVIVGLLLIAGGATLPWRGESCSRCRHFCWGLAWSSS